MGYLWHVKNWFKVGKEFSWNLSFNTLLGFMSLNKHFQNNFFLRHADKKHEYIISYLEKEFASLIEKYKSIPEETNTTNEKTIWTLWWQGEQNAPDLVKACLEQLKRNANGAEIIILTKDNYKNYIELPDYILEKRDKGYISFAQLSDIIRFTLLEKYGGLWLDSTIYTSKPISDEYFSRPFFSQHTKWCDTCFVQHNLWHGFSIGSKKGGKLVSFAKEIFYEYWKKQDTLIDYLMIDYIIMLAYINFSDIKSEIDSLPYSSEKLYDLVNLLSKEFNEEHFDLLMEECIFSKLDWHKKYKSIVKGKETYYSHIVNL